MSPAEYEALMVIARRQARSLSDCLFIPVVAEREGVATSRRNMAEHEAAHAVVTMALGGACVFVTIEVPGAQSPEGTGVLLLPNHSAYGVAAIAGNAWDLCAEIGVLDARILLDVVDAEIGNLSHRRDVVGAYLRVWRLRATELLIRTFDKVMAVADALEKSGALTEPELRRIGRFPPPSDPAVIRLLRDWRRSLEDKGNLLVPPHLRGAHELAKMVYERKKAA